LFLSINWVSEKLLRAPSIVRLSNIALFCANGSSPHCSPCNCRPASGHNPSRISSISSRMLSRKLLGQECFEGSCVPLTNYRRRRRLTFAGAATREKAGTHYRNCHLGRRGAFPPESKDPRFSFPAIPFVTPTCINRCGIICDLPLKPQPDRTNPVHPERRGSEPRYRMILAKRLS
jgi:hypothetical protein